MMTTITPRHILLVQHILSTIATRAVTPEEQMTEYLVSARLTTPSFFIVETENDIERAYTAFSERAFAYSMCANAQLEALRALRKAPRTPENARAYADANAVLNAANALSTLFDIARDCVSCILDHMRYANVRTGDGVHTRRDQEHAAAYWESALKYARKLGADEHFLKMIED